jgi:hypothetical protein
VLFFTFFRRGDVDLDTLPQRTTLQRVIVERLRTGGHWNIWQGRFPQSAISQSDVSDPTRIESQP